MSDQAPRQPNDKKPSSPRSEAADSASLPTIDLSQEGVVSIGELNLQAGGSDVPLAQIPEPPSGQSLTSWTEVIRRQRAAQAAAKATDGVEVDAPSDRDLLDRMKVGDDSKQGMPRSADTSQIRQSDLPVYIPPAQPASESDIDLGRALPGGSTTGSEVGFDILYPPSDAGGAMPLPALESLPLSAKDFRPPIALAADSEEIPFAANATTGMSGVDLGAAATPGAEQSRSSILDVLLRESGGGALPPQPPEPPSDVLEFGQPLPPHKTTMPRGANVSDRPAVTTQPGIDLADDSLPIEAGVDLSGPVSSIGSDEAVDLYAEAGDPPSLTDSGTLEISEEAMVESQRKAEQQESSSIDLDSRPSVVGTEFDINVPQAGAVSDSDIDLSLPPIDDETASSLINKREALEANQSALAAEIEARRKRQGANDDSGRPSPRSRPVRREVVPARDDDDVPAARRRGYLLHGGVIGLLLGAGGVLAAYFGGALPDRQKGNTNPGTGTDNSAAMTQLRQEAATAKANETKARESADAVRKSLTDAGIDPDKAAESVKKLADAKTASDAQIASLTSAAQKARTDLAAARKNADDARLAEDAAKRQLTDADKAATNAKKQLADVEKASIEVKKQLADATKAVDAAKAETVATKKAGDEAVETATKAFKAAELKEKETAGKLADAVKREGELVKNVDAAKKALDDASKARDASAATVAAVTERLVKAKFVGDKPDVSALVKGLDDAIKIATTDATATLRDELAKARVAEAKLKSDLSATKDKEAETAKAAAVFRADAQKHAAEAAQFKAAADKYVKEAADAKAKADDATKIAADAKVSSDRLATEVSRLSTDNERLTRDLNTVRELADLIKNQPAITGSTVKLDPTRLADRFFGEGLRAFHAGQYSGAESAFRKAIQFRGDDARYHYLLGLSLWMSDEQKAAAAAFEKGRDLEQEARPTSRTISTALEKIQGPARQAINAYRP